MSGPPDDRAFRDVMARFVTGITVLSTVDEDGVPHGMTANAVSSVSLDPLLVLVCVARDTTMARVVQHGNGLALSFLAADQARVSDRFADPDRPYGREEFADLPTHVGVTGVPLLDGAAAWVECDLHAVHDGGDHLLVLGAVRRAELGDADAGVLLYTPQGYDRWPAG